MKSSHHRSAFFALACCILLAAAVPAPVSAHYASITVDNYSPEPGEAVTVTIGFGHAFPGDGEMRRAAYDNTVLTVIDPTGAVTPVPIIPNDKNGNQPIRVTFSKPGTHTLVLAQKNFSSKTTKGYKYKPRNKLENVLHARWSETISKTVVTVGTAGQELKPAETGDRFQIVPLAVPCSVPADGLLPVRILLDGKPWSGMVYATYAGFSGKADTFAYTTRTDKEGIAEIKLLANGLWLVKADWAYPYENKDEADEYSLKATLTFKK